MASPMQLCDTKLTKKRSAVCLNNPFMTEEDCFSFIAVTTKANSFYYTKLLFTAFPCHEFEKRVAEIRLLGLELRAECVSKTVYDDCVTVFNYEVW
jgi:hypothetical protein